MATPASAIVIRHDRDDSAYREAAKPYTMVCSVGGAMGTLIDPEWVITAAHVADGLPRKSATVKFGDRSYPVAEVHVHPDFANRERHRDIALLRLARPVSDIEPAGLYEAEDELNRRVTLVGNGDTGTGHNGPEKKDRVMRAAHNTVTGVRPGWLSFRFDRPPAGDELEGISGPGDSGGPALIDTAGRLMVAGVSAYNDGSPPCTYETTEHYCRVSSELAWLRKVMGGKAEGEGKPRLMHFGQNEDGETTVERIEPEVIKVDQAEDAAYLQVVGALVAAINTNDQDAYMRLFSPRLLAARRDDPLEGVLAFMQGVRSKRGDIVRLHEPSPRSFGFADSEFPMRPITFHLKDGMPGYIGISIDRDQKIDHLSLFVRESVCPHGASCTESKPLAEVLER